ncbi:MAG: hypothetical protein ACPLW5_03705 [Candidatus Bathyarchaeales archaeon]
MNKENGKKQDLRLTGHLRDASGLKSLFREYMPQCAKHGDFTCERLKRRQKNG